MKPLVQEFPQRVFRIFEEQTVVAKRRHGNGDLSQVVEILQHRTLQKNHQTQGTRAKGGEHSPREARAPEEASHGPSLKSGAMAAPRLHGEAPGVSQQAEGGRSDFCGEGKARQHKQI